MARIDKVNQAIKEEVGQIILLEVKDPRLKLVTVTQVEVSRDLQHARVFFSVLGDALKVRDAEEGLASAKGFIRKLVGQRVKMRYTPEIDFIFDRSIEYSLQIQQAIERVNNELKSDS